MFSITTIALSTIRPNAITNPISETELSVIPTCFITIQLTNIDNGITIDTINASRRLIKRNNTNITTISPEKALSITVPKLSSTSSAKFEVIIISTSSV